MGLPIAIIADIHANLEALAAVLSDISAKNVHQIYCLGDVVGYGPNPRECVDRAMTFSVCLMGDHDKLALEGEVANPQARPFVHRTRRQLAIGTRGADDADRRREFLRNLPLTHHENGMLYLHGSPHDPLNGYVFPEFVFDRRKMEELFSLVEVCCFMGHTHLPGIFTPDCEFYTPNEIGFTWQLRADSKVMCNVGSVGQPGDADDRACYCVFDGNTIHFHRVVYDIDTTARKLKDPDRFPP